MQLYRTLSILDKYRNTINVIFLCWIIAHSGSSQSIDKSYSYKNFDGSEVQITFNLKQSTIDYFNRNWYDIISRSNNKRENYFRLIKSLFYDNQDSLGFVYNMFNQNLHDVSDEYFINTVIRFVQSLPYKIPPSNFNGKKTSGILAPMICLSQGYGDCDTKSLLLCCILGHKYELLFLVGESHAFIGIKSDPSQGKEYVEIKGCNYVLCEMTSFWPLGELPVSSKYDINSGKYQYTILKY
jgi:hypothetical protein